MNRIVQTKDHSYTLYSDVFNEHYHSVNGALTESTHIFIQNGLHAANKQKINILEIGFGTGLNAVLTHLETTQQHLNVTYHGIDLYPPALPILENYYNRYEEPVRSAGIAISKLPWGKLHACSNLFTLKKTQADFTKFDFKASYDLVYFDAFSPETHPEAWTYTMFKKISSHLSPKGILVTFSSKGMVKRNLQDAGFSINILPGPPGKRHITQAMKNS
ncbi:MAG: tRNA (5-methylaminomethyl-2-thiouridine)(34)-methyltransferase MnmD [Bacteroidota bacterium]|nr:tRNA (5-methylaminomethyl-2-thiouridine)(34)-methyltransferase MnmD [Bacteroidota bacterium]